jgi:hypothetical protein
LACLEIFMNIARLVSAGLLVAFLGLTACAGEVTDSKAPDDQQAQTQQDPNTETIDEAKAPPKPVEVGAKPQTWNPDGKTASDDWENRL